MASLQVKLRRRYGHCAIAISGTVYIWGGRDKEYMAIPASEIEIFPIATTGVWERKITTGTPPRAGFQSACVVIGTTLYLFGGRGDYGCSNELHCLDSGDLGWKKVEVRNPSEGPQPKHSCGMVVHAGKELVVIGGRLEDGSMTNELHTFNFSESECT